MIRKVDRRGSSVWVVDLRFKTLNGVRERYRKDAQVQTREGAQAEERRVLTHFAQHGSISTLLSPPEPPKVLTWGAAVTRFKKVTYEVGGRSGEGFSPNTRTAYDSVLRALSSWSDRELSTIDRKFVEEYLARLVDASAAKRALHLAVIRSVITAYTGTAPDLPKLPRAPSKARPAREEDLDQLVQEPAIGWAVELARQTGMRGGELMALQWGDVDVDQRVIVVRRQFTRGQIRHTKSNQVRSIPITVAFAARLKAERDRRDVRSDDLVCVRTNGQPWRRLGSAVKRAMVRLGFSGRPIHPIRHTFLTRIGQHDPIAAQQIAGHSSLDTTMGYIRHVDDARKSAAVDRAFSAKVPKPRGKR